MKKAFELAVKVRENSYSPYSKFKVGAAVLTRSGQVFSGTNVENAAYGSTICAERSAILSAVSSGHIDIFQIVVATDHDTPAAPCGACRQVMLEFLPPDGKVHLANLSGIVKTMTMAELCPFPFTSKDI